jgi:aspartyl/glutamyl-tRNA(Asn/Gln) amidotransferase C subunit
MSASKTSTLINYQTTTKIANLSRLQSSPSQEFLDKYTTELNNVLDYVTEIQTQDTTGIEATDIMQTITVEQLREDKPPTNLAKYNKTRQNIKAGFPKRKGDLLELPTRII